ncbi:MAG: hypothetical protein ACPGR7_10020 [Flavobacteriaceae bacterium]
MDDLKNIWSKQDLSTDHVDAVEVKKLMSKKAKSLAFWVLIISLGEFALSNLPLLFMDYDAAQEDYRTIGMDTFMNVISIITYSVSLIFIYLFYKNYRTISIEKSVKGLLRSIVKTRKVVKMYIYYNLTAISFVYLIFIVVLFSNKENLIHFGHLPPTTNLDEIWLPALIITIVTLMLIVGLIALFYRLTYGYILRRLMRNYKELNDLHKKKDY